MRRSQARLFSIVWGSYWGCNVFPRPSAVERMAQGRGNDHVEAVYELRTHNFWPGKMRFGFRRPLSLAKANAVVP